MTNILTTFGSILAGVWMLAIANKVVGDAWDVLLSEHYKKWLTHFKKHGEEVIVKTIGGQNE